jgi:hypothetical protein
MAVVTSLGLHPASRMQDTGLGLERSGKFVCVRVTNRPRSREQKQAFYL